MSHLLEAVRGCTFDDFLFAPRFSVLERRDPKSIDLSARFSEHITLKHPIVSANMDTITRAAMAVVQAEEGGLGIIDRGFRVGDISAQVREVEIVKRTQHGVVTPRGETGEASLAAFVGGKVLEQRRLVNAAGHHGTADAVGLERPHDGVELPHLDPGDGVDVIPEVRLRLPFVRDGDHAHTLPARGACE